MQILQEEINPPRAQNFLPPSDSGFALFTQHTELIQYRKLRSNIDNMLVETHTTASFYNINISPTPQKNLKNRMKLAERIMKDNFSKKRAFLFSLGTYLKFSLAQEKRTQSNVTPVASFHLLHGP